MKKLISLMRACMTDNMSLFKIKNKNQTRVSKKLLPLALTILCFIAIWSYANMFMEPLDEINLEYVVLTLFILVTFILTLQEGIYKSGNLLFNCKDDNLLLSLPVKKSTVLFVRILKFYIFEVLYNSLFLLPAMIAYLRYVNVDNTYYLVSIIALLLLPIIPVVISCIIGAIISAFSSKFKFKNLAQIAITTVFLLLIFYISFNIENIIKNIAENAVSINDVITKIYYPAGAYIKLITNFNVKDLIIFVLANLSIFAIAIAILGNIYFKINSKVKVVKSSSNKKNYKIKANKPIKALIKKEFKRFSNSPVFVVNAGFGLVFFLVGCIAIALKYDSLINTVISQIPEISAEQISAYIPVLLFGFICFTSLMSSITSSMISLEGKSFNILKSLPVKPYTIIISKIATAVLIIFPFMFIGDLIVFIKFKFTILEIILILLSSVILPLVAETIGIIVNIKYPRMDAENDTQVVKQSMSSMISVYTGMILIGLTGFATYKCLEANFSVDLTILGGLAIYSIIYILLLIYLKKKSVKEFEMINA